MKKRIISTMLMASMLLSMTACGASTETPDTDDSGAEVTTTAAAEDTEAGGDVTEETTTAETEAPKEVKKITEWPKFLFKDGMVFEVDDITYIYNIADNKMYDCGEDTGVYSVCGKIACLDRKLHNLETGETYDVELYNHDYVDEYNPVYKIEKNFDGDTFYFGVIDKNGEWVVPLSSEYEICKREYAQDFNVRGGYMVYGDLIYDWKTDKMTELYYDRLDGLSEGILIIEGYPDNYDYYKYDPATGERTLLYEGDDFDSDNFRWRTQSNGTWISDGKDEYTIVFDNSLNKICEFDYYANCVYAANEDYVVFDSPNGNDIYTIILDKDGNRVVEPFISTYGGSFVMIGDYVMNGSRIINCKTGEIKEWADDYAYEIFNFFPEAGKILVTFDGAYYIVDVSDLDTLINPFEIAQ